MPFATELTKKLGIEYPIIQAPLAGGGDTPALVSAVCNAGGLGFIGGAYLTPVQITEAARAVRAKTTRPFGINLFTPMNTPEVPKDAELAIKRLAPFFAELDLSSPAVPAKT
jgi:nitronate monooxygenase